VLYCHSYGGCKSEGEFLGEVGFDNQMNLVLMDMSGCGVHPCKEISFGKEDALLI
jgi:hypothetical protein